MNETSLENVPSEQKKITPALSEPHFDDTSIATARPVQPLVETATIQRQSKLNSLLRRLSVFAVVAVAVAIVTVVTFAVGLSALRQQSKVSEPDEAMKVEASIQPQTDTPTIVPNLKNAVQRPKIRQTTSIRSKSVARKVGTIYYGR